MSGSRKPIQKLSDQEWEELADGMLSLSKSDGFPSLLELLARIGQLAKDCAIEGEEDQLKYHRGWLACADYLTAQLQALPAQAQARRELKSELPEGEKEQQEFVSLIGLVAGDGSLS